MKLFANLFIVYLVSGILVQGADRPNIVFIFSDDHALDAISAYSDRFADISPTPNIDRIANEGMLFRHSYCGNSICGPSRAAIVTGKHSHLNGYMDNNFSRFDGTQATFPKMLQDAGYSTAVIGKWHLVSNPTGFDHWEILPGQGKYYNPDFIQMDGTTEKFDGYVTDLVADKSIEWIKNRKDKSKPFLLMSQQKAPHRNWVPAERHFNYLDGVTIPEPSSLFDDHENRVSAVSEAKMSISKDFNWSHDMLLPGKATDPRFETKMLDWEYKRMSDAQKAAFEKAYGAENDALLKSLEKGMSDKELTSWKYQRYIKNYLRCIKAVDENIGKILDYLDESGLAENTIVIYSSDQGFYLGEHGWYDKRWMFEESLSMPFVIKWPGTIQPKVRTEAFIQNIDYAPTFLEIAGAPIPDDMQGKSIVPILENAGEAPEDWREAIYYLYSGEDTHSVARHDGVRNARYKIMHFPDSDEWMLFDLQKDPKELSNVADEEAYSEILIDMKNLYRQLRAKYNVSSSTYPRSKLKVEWWKERWEQKNEELEKIDPSSAPRIVFLGDSITQSWEQGGKAAWEKHFAPLGALNWGYAGDETHHLIWRLQNGNIQRVAPEVAVILIGTNNTGRGQLPPSETYAGIKRVIEDLAWKWPETKIILTSIFPRGQFQQDPLRLINKEINGLVQGLDDGERVHVMNINQEFLGKNGEISKDLFPDYLHLSETAYEIWAEALSSKLSSLGIKAD